MDYERMSKNVQIHHQAYDTGISSGGIQTTLPLRHTQTGLPACLCFNKVAKIPACNTLVNFFVSLKITAISSSVKAFL